MIAQKKILIYRLGSLGDTIVALPCFNLLARAYPCSERILLTNEPVHAKAPAAWSVLGQSGLIHDYISYPVGTRSVVKLAKLAWKLRRLKIETLIYLTPPRGKAALTRDKLFFRLCGIREIIGIPHGRLASYEYNAATDRYEAEASRLARCISEIGNARLNDRRSWQLFLTENEQARGTDVLQSLDNKPFLVLGIASKQNVTDWGVTNWKELMPLLWAKFSGHALVFIGAKEDFATIEEVAAQWAGESLNLAGALSPRESAAVIEKADLYLGVDSGPMHLAASVGAQCVSVSGANRLPGTWFPFGEQHEVIFHKTNCFGCNLETCTVEKNKCILSISASEVAAAVERSAQRRLLPVQPRFL